MPYQPQRLPMMVAGASPAEYANPPLLQSVEPQPFKGLHLPPLFERIHPSPFSRPPPYPQQVPEVDDDVPMSALLEYMDRHQPSMMEKFYNEQARTGEGFWKTIEKLSVKYHDLLSEPDPAIRKALKQLFDAEVAETLGKAPPSEFDI